MNPLLAPGSSSYAVPRHASPSSSAPCTHPEPGARLTSTFLCHSSPGHTEFIASSLVLPNGDHLGGNTHYWKPFDQMDSGRMESASGRGSVSVLGGRYDAILEEREPDGPTHIMRASWFYQGPTSHWIPFPESAVATLEAHYTDSSMGHQKRISLGNDLGIIVFHSREIMFYTPPSPQIDAARLDNWGQTNQVDIKMALRKEPSPTPRIVHRGLEGLPPIPEGESEEMEHLIFVVHGVGKYCDMKLRDLTGVVSSTRDKMASLSEKHFQSAHLAGSARRIELLPITWHGTLHGEDTGTDARLRPLTLKSIPKLRNFMNDTLMDILFYTSPVFGQTIVDTVVSEINRVYRKFLDRNPSFSGTVSVMGHSLGSVILFDILSHQKAEEEVLEPKAEEETTKPTVLDDPKVETIEELFKKLDIGSEYSELFVSEGIDLGSLKTFSSEDLKEVALPEEAVKKIMGFFSGGPSLAKTEEEEGTTLDDYNKKAIKSDVEYVRGPAGTGQLSVHYPQLDFQPSAFYALGSPIALFLAIRGISSLGEDFSLPTCPEFFNIFHPYDPVAYRMEAMVNPQYSELRPLTIPHHMGRKRMHLELKDTVTKLMTSDIRKKILEGVSYTLSSVYNMATGQTQAPDELERTVEDEVLRKEELRRREDESNPKTMRSGLNGGNRIDYVLQEAPLESFNEYLFAIASHISYWESEDVALLILKNVYSKMNIRCDEDINVHNHSEMGSFVDGSQPMRMPGHPPATNLPYVPYAVPSPQVPPNIIPPPQVPLTLMPSPQVPPTLMSGPAAPPTLMSCPAAPPTLMSAPQVPLIPVGPSANTQIYTPSLPPSIEPVSSSMPPQFYDPNALLQTQGGSSTTTKSGVPPPPMPTLYDPNTAIPLNTPTSRPSGYPKVYHGVPSSGTGYQMGMDPTAPLAYNAAPIGPPPMGGAFQGNK
ncbi:SEC23interacting proteinlike [Caligus rogercresseyi]|uniref:SEC23interacting proteinlike n=1 Tax=Caligus rogercresseyi TaxID=217165 RepID=A0A7T8KAU2_CALRO|nr:SEC23interacting proteinlike [Caligus rogercresseyi]